LVFAVTMAKGNYQPLAYVTDQNNGLYSVHYMIASNGDMQQRSGTYIVDINQLTLDGRRVAIKGSPYALVASAPQTASPMFSNIQQPTHSVVAGQISALTIFARDTNGQMYSNFDLVFVVTESSPGSATVSYVREGEYQCDFVTTISGPLTITITLEGMPIQGSPMTIEVLPGPVFPPNIVASGQGISGGQIGKTANFQLTEYDQWNNRRHTCSTIRVHAEFIDGSAHVSLQPNNDGTWAGSYKMSDKPAQHLLYIEADGVHVKGSPFQVNPYETSHAARNTVWGIGLVLGTGCVLGFGYTKMRHTVFGEYLSIPSLPSLFFGQESDGHKSRPPPLSTDLDRL